MEVSPENEESGAGIAGAGSPTIEEVETIGVIPDAVLRNLRITQCYAELSAALTGRLGRSANWCTFATWASRQAGRTIRGEDLEDALGRMLDDWLHGGGADAVASTLRALGAKRSIGEIRGIVRGAIDPAGALARASAAVARGNLKVFQEIAREFARFHATFALDEAPDDDRLARFLATLRAGDPPEGQQLLRQAFGRYYRAFFDAEPAVRAQRILHANLEVGLHEQTRLQPEIAEAIDAGLPSARALTPELLAGVLPARGALARARRFVTRLFGGRTPLDRAVEALVAEARVRTRRVITEHLMTLELSPHHTLRLGHDLDVSFPASLSHLADGQLLALLARIDPTPDSPRESGARDWASLPERMHFIADLFRCYHETAELLEPPYTADQVTALRAGRIPSGRL